MDDEKSTKMKFKNTINDLFTKDNKNHSHTRSELMKKIKNIILSNDNLNHHVDIDFDFKQEYNEMNKTMKKFNTIHIQRKNIINELSKENQFFSKSYSNMISSLINRIEKKNINYQTISDFNTKYVKHRDKNFFFHNPLLTTKQKDLTYFYLNQKNTDEEEDQYLNYSKKLLNKINKQYPSLKINNIIKDYNNQTTYRLNMEKKRTQRIKTLNGFYKDKNLTERNNTKNMSKTLKLNKNFFKEKLNDLNNEHKIKEIKVFNKYNIDLNKDKNKVVINNSKNYFKGNSQENDKINIKNEYNKGKIVKEPNKNIKSPKNRNSINKRVIEFIPLTNRNTKGNLNQNFINKLFNLGMNEKEISNIKEKIKELKLKRIRKLKGSIHIKNIYNDYLKTKKIIDDYKRDNTTKLKYLYYSCGKKKLVPFQRNEKENYKINKIGYNLFWTINK